ncbi:GNAT family N-acetyltransferase [Microbacterium sp. gxy059]|uniref:GNAT family N-acetyltransferase n=1 Tax=Microbacterium sp. gxy059 TaxID=2957199 RepID=UPI003D97F913
MPAPRLLPRPTARLRFREMVAEDAGDLLRVWGDADAMRFYPAPKTADEMDEWILRMRRRYAEDGIGLWILETHDGAVVGDGGLTWQEVNGRRVLEVGYHVVPEQQRRGYASEAAAACAELARSRFAPIDLTAIIHPENVASRRVAESLGMTHTEDDHGHPWIVRTVMSMSLDATT